MTPCPAACFYFARLLRSVPPCTIPIANRLILVTPAIAAGVFGAGAGRQAAGAAGASRIERRTQVGGRGRRRRRRGQAASGAGAAWGFWGGGGTVETCCAGRQTGAGGIRIWRGPVPMHSAAAPASEGGVGVSR